MSKSNKIEDTRKELVLRDKKFLGEDSNYIYTIITAERYSSTPDIEVKIHDGRNTVSFFNPNAEELLSNLEASITTARKNLLQANERAKSNLEIAKRLHGEKD